MSPRIPASYYSDASVFAHETSRFLKSAWTFAGVKRELKENDDFLTLTVGTKSVVVQNFDGELRAFHNVCSHRFATIQNEPCGNRRLQCPYHGWIYDESGKPYAIPKRPKFPEMNDDLQCAMRLEQFDIEHCGEFVFVRERLSEGLSLSEHLGDLFPILASLSAGIGDRIDRNEMTIKANWKICVENTLESYHVGFVHTNTFKRLGLVDQGFGFYGPHSEWTGEVDPTVKKKFERLKSLFDTRPYVIPGYQHLLIFPGITIGTTYGSSFAIQEFKPISPGETVFISHVFGCVLEGLSEAQKAMVGQMNNSIVEFNRSVFEEDRVVTEYVQIGSAQTQQPGILSDEEERVCAFQNAYMAGMSDTGWTH